VYRPDRLRITTRTGQTVEADLVRIDEVRDIAILKPKTPLAGVPPLAIDDRAPIVGESVWALGHTGRGYWKLSWGMSGGIASGVVEMFDNDLLLFDASLYPGFSGGPIVTIDPSGKPRVIAVSHAILYTGSTGFSPTGAISSGITSAELRDVIAGKPPTIQAALAAYATEQRGKVWADLFITDRLSVSRDSNDQQVAVIYGNAKSIDADDKDTRIPAAAMLFGLPKGAQTVDFEVHDPGDAVVANDTKSITVGDAQRVAFASTQMHFAAKSNGKYSVVVKRGGAEIGRTFVHLELGNDDDDLVDEDDADSVDDGQPDVDVVVAQSGHDDPLMMSGIRAAWAEKSYPRRVSFTWFARATRGWAGTNVSITAFVLDEKGNVVGRSDGCFENEIRPEKTWSCVGGMGGLAMPPLADKQGAYDIVFAINDRPVAWWPMEATIQKDPAPGSAAQRWMKELRRIATRRVRPAPTPPKAPSAPAKATAAPAKPK
jgi:S1-C subfamily serine protease